MSAVTRKPSFTLPLLNFLNWRFDGKKADGYVLHMFEIQKHGKFYCPWASIIHTQFEYYSERYAEIFYVE